MCFSLILSALTSLSSIFCICLHPGQISLLQNQVLSLLSHGDIGDHRSSHCTECWRSLGPGYITVSPSPQPCPPPLAQVCVDCSLKNITTLFSLLPNAGMLSWLGTMVLTPYFLKNIFGFHFSLLSFLY